ncbi:MAG: cell division protein PerM, partial [Georgenia sp.]
MSTTTPARPPHVIDAPSRRRPGVPEGWLRGLVAGAESASFGLLALVVPAVATYVATAAAPALGEASWQAAAGIGAGLWLLAHGVPVSLGAGATLSLVPLGATLLSLGLVHAATRRMRLPGAGAAAFVPVGYLAVVLVALRLAPGTAALPALAGGLLVAALG